MSAPETRLEVYKSTDKTFHFSPLGGNPLSVVGIPLRFCVRKTARRDSKIEIDKSIGNGINVIDDVEGEYDVVLVPEDTDDLPADDYYWTVTSFENPNAVYAKGILAVLQHSGKFALDEEEE